MTNRERVAERMAAIVERLTVDYGHLEGTGFEWIGCDGCGSQTSPAEVDEWFIGPPDYCRECRDTHDLTRKPTHIETAFFPWTEL